MGVFFVCWLPFFTVYVVLAICGKGCESFPGVVVDFLFVSFFEFFYSRLILNLSIFLFRFKVDRLL